MSSQLTIPTPTNFAVLNRSEGINQDKSEIDLNKNVIPSQFNLDSLEFSVE